MYILSSPFLMMSFFLCIVGNLLSVSSMSWLGLWLGMEINLFSFLVLTNPEGFSVVQPSVVYFVVQSIGSMMLILGFMFNFYELSSWGSVMIVGGLMMKSGLVPFHSWVPSVVGCASWLVSLMILTWQKLGPFVFFSLFPGSVIIYMSLILMCMVGCLGGLSQNSVRMMAVYSSFVHNSWLLAGLLSSFPSFIIYFLVYCIGLIFFFVSCMMSSKIVVNSYLVSIIGMMGVLVLSGVPPFMGFFSKLIVVLVGPFMLLIFCILSSVISLKFYMVFFYSMMLSSGHNKERGFSVMNFLWLFIFMNFVFMMVCFIMFIS